MAVDIIKLDYDFSVHHKYIKDQSNYMLKHNLANNFIIVAYDKDIKRFSARTARKQKRHIDALEFKPISDFYMEG